MGSGKGSEPQRKQSHLYYKEMNTKVDQPQREAKRGQMQRNPNISWIAHPGTHVVYDYMMVSTSVPNNKASSSAMSKK